MNITDDQREELSPSAKALEELYDKMLPDNDKYLDETLFPVLSSMKEGEAFSLEQVMTESDIADLLKAAMVLKKTTYVKQLFSTGDTSEEDAAIAMALHYSADRIQQFALMLAVTKGLSDYVPVGELEFPMDDIRDQMSRSSLAGIFSVLLGDHD